MVSNPNWINPVGVHLFCYLCNRTKNDIDMANDLNVNWKDGVGEVTDQPLTISPGSGTGNASVSFGSVMNKGLDRTLELEITTPKGVKKTLTVNQEGCRQAYITSDGKRWLTSDNRVYGVLKSDAPCQCEGICPVISYVRPDGSITDISSNDCIGVVLQAQSHSFMICKNYIEGYPVWGEYDTNHTNIIDYINVDGSNDHGFLRKMNGSYDGDPVLSSNVSSWTSGALSDWDGKANSEVLKGVATGVESYASYETIGHALNEFLASDDAKGFDDWYIPSCGQLALIFMYLYEINDALYSIGGEGFVSYIHWSSSEYDHDYGWGIDLHNGVVRKDGKQVEHRLRFIRDI